MPIRNRKDLKPQRRTLRNDGTAAEAVLWGYLKERQILGMKFRRQESIGPYIVDFYCPECRLVIELDGAPSFLRRGGCAPHYGIPGAERDGRRTSYLEEGHLKVIRF